MRNNRFKFLGLLIISVLIFYFLITVLKIISAPKYHMESSLKKVSPVLKNNIKFETQTIYSLNEDSVYVYLFNDTLRLVIMQNTNFPILGLHKINLSFAKKLKVENNVVYERISIKEGYLFISSVQKLSVNPELILNKEAFVDTSKMVNYNGIIRNYKGDFCFKAADHTFLKYESHSKSMITLAFFTKADYHCTILIQQSVLDEDDYLEKLIKYED
jgi:hypothetical protein